MGWKDYQKQPDSERRASAHALAKWQRQQDKLAKEWAKQAALDSAAREAAQFERYLTELTSLHRDCTSGLDWASIAVSSPPPEPSRGNRNELAARAHLNDYRPTLVEKLTGAAKKKAATLEAAVADARKEDDREHAAALQEHRQHTTEWELLVRLASGIVNRSPAAYKQAIDYLATFDAIEAFRTKVTIEHVDADVLVIRLDLLDPELIPEDEVKLTSTGKLSTKAFAAARRWALYQDHVCSCAWRSAREAFASTPIGRLIVNVYEPRLDTSTGHVAPAPILGVHFVRANMVGIRFETVDPSDALKHVSHRMNFKKTAGFEPISPVSLDENWISAG